MTQVRCIYVASINTGEACAKCAICRNTIIVSDDQDNDNKETNRQQEVIVGQVDGRLYTFDTADYALMFKRFSSVYGNTLADD